MPGEEKERWEFDHNSIGWICFAFVPLPRSLSLQHITLPHPGKRGGRRREGVCDREVAEAVCDLVSFLILCWSFDIFMKCFSLKGWLRPYGAPTARRRRRGGETGCGEGYSHQALVAIMTMSIIVIIYFIFISSKCITNNVFNIYHQHHHLQVHDQWFRLTQPLSGG